MALPDAERAIFTDLYRYYEKYQPRTFDLATFCEAADEMALKVRDHGQSPLAQRVFGAVYEYFGDRHKAIKEDQCQ